MKWSPMSPSGSPPPSTSSRILPDVYSGGAPGPTRGGQGRQVLPWPPVLEVCDQLVSEKGIAQGEAADHPPPGDEPSATKSAIAGLLREALEHDPVPIPMALEKRYGKSWNIWPVHPSRRRSMLLHTQIPTA